MQNTYFNARKKSCTWLLKHVFAARGDWRCNLFIHWLIDRCGLAAALPKFRFPRTFASSTVFCGGLHPLKTHITTIRPMPCLNSAQWKFAKKCVPRFATRRCTQELEICTYFENIEGLSQEQARTENEVLNTSCFYAKRIFKCLSCVPTVYAPKKFQTIRCCWNAPV